MCVYYTMDDIVLSCVGLNMYRVGVTVCLLCWLSIVCDLGLGAK